MNVKVSVIMPSLNVGKYIERCLKSVQCQTLTDIEIICVDAGSTDGTLETIKELAAEDKRITIINSDRKSYGYQMNLGLNKASGEYIGIVETDDFIEPDMFEKLYTQAKKENLEVIKSDFWFYWSKGKKNIKYGFPKVLLALGVISPLESFENFKDQAALFDIKPSIWSAIYRRSFINDNGIRFNETPGASFQDSSFNFKVLALAKRVRLVPEAYLHYRQDNETSSVNSPSKVYCVCDEYKVMDDFINGRFTGRAWSMVQGIKTAIKFNSYLWNYGRLAAPLNREFIIKVAEEFLDDADNGKINPDYFVDYKWQMLQKWMDDPIGFADECEKTFKEGLFMKAIRKIKRTIG